jgi:subtilase family serine protease
MKQLSKRFLLFLLLCCLLAACGPIDGVTPAPASQRPSTPTAKAPPTQRPAITVRKATNDPCPADLQNAATCFTPHALRVAYGVQSLTEQGFTGKGQTVIDIVSFGSPTLQQDMDVFDQQFGLPPIKLQVIAPLNVPEYDPRHDKGGWADETTLDVQIIHAIAPDANVIVLQSPVAETEGTIGLPEFLQLEQYAVSHHLGNIISQSWGASEVTLQDTAGQQEIQQWDAFYKQATTQQGITILSSSGDEGATDYADLQGKHLSSVATTSFPADDPWVTSVGGTTLTNNGSTLSERVWNSNGGASGGGFSRFFKTPTYQQTLPATVQSQLNNRRGVPDVSADADPSTGLAIYTQGQWIEAGGTSASAPLWAGIVAVANQMAGHPLGFINPALYRLAASSTYNQDFFDITTGDNTDRPAHVTGYPAVQGWDPVTGLGTPNAEKLIPDLIAAMK